MVEIDLTRAERLEPRFDRLMAKVSPGIRRAQVKYLVEYAGRLNNREYWDRFGVQFESGKMCDSTLSPHLHTFMSLLTVKDDPVLEVGCGAGRSLKVLGKKAPKNYLGIDTCAGVIDLAQKDHPQHEFKVCDVLEFIPSLPFGGAIASDVLLYLSPLGQLKALNNINRSLYKDSPLMIRWAKGEDRFKLKHRTLNKETQQSLVFLASDEYIGELLDATGFQLSKRISLPVFSEKALINKGTKEEREEEYILVFAEKAKSA